MRAEVIIPRSPTMTRWVRPKFFRTTSTISLKATGSAVLPGKTLIATGQPFGSVKSPYSIWGFPLFASREYPKEARGQVRPSIHDEERSKYARPDGLFEAERCRLESARSITSWRS